MSQMSYFYLLKKELLERYQEAHPYWQGSIHDFKTKEIANFQALLEQQVGSRLSEKWFYTHLKPLENKKLPREDTLNLLSAFIGYESWAQFVYSQTEEQKKEKERSSKSVKAARLSFRKSWMLLATLLIMLVFSAFLFYNTESTYTICFVDADKGTPVEGLVEIQIFQNGETPFIKKANRKACIDFEWEKEKLHFAVSAPYYKSDTILRSFRSKEKKEIIKLHRDDFSMMIHLFSTNNVKDWKKRRRQLDKMLDENAVVFQIDKNGLGLEMYNKIEFINKLTMPINSLKNIQILDTQYRKGKILELRFVQNR